MDIIIISYIIASLLLLLNGSLVGLLNEFLDPFFVKNYLLDPATVLLLSLFWILPVFNVIFYTGTIFVLEAFIISYLK